MFKKYTIEEIEQTQLTEYIEQYGNYSKVISDTNSSFGKKEYKKTYVWTSEDPYYYISIDFESKDGKNYILYSKYISYNIGEYTMTFSDGTEFSHQVLED